MGPLEEGVQPGSSKVGMVYRQPGLPRLHGEGKQYARSLVDRG